MSKKTEITVANVTSALIEYMGRPICTTRQLAEFYGCEAESIQKNFERNSSRFEEGKHFIKLEGDALRQFKIDIQSDSRYVPERTARILLWTEKGAARHAKMLSTDQAWEVFEQLEDVYFNSKQGPRVKASSGETAKALPNTVGATRAHLMVVSAMEKMGVRKEMAMAVALQAIHHDTGLTTEGYRLALPGVEDVCNLNQKQLGELLGVSSEEVGNLLRKAGLMVIDEAGQRVVTEKGRQFGEMRPFKAFNGHAGYEPRWNKSVLDFFAQQAA